MAEVKWIKIVTDIFDNRKIKQIEVMPEGDSILVVWFKLICLAGNINDNGMVYFTPEVPYTDEMLATEFRRPLNIIRLALATFEKFGMIEIIDNFLYLSSWEKYQSVERLERMRTKNAERQARFRAKKREELAENNVTVTQDVTPSNAVEEDKEEDRDIEEEKEIEHTADEPPAPFSHSVPYETIKDLYNTLCPSFPKCTALSDARKKAIKARMSSGYTLDDFKTLFTKAENSSFLKGKNDRNWRASFDWLLKDANMAKVLDGNYDDARGAKPNGGNSGNSEPPKRYGTYV